MTKFMMKKKRALVEKPKIESISPVVEYRAKLNAGAMAI